MVEPSVGVPVPPPDLSEVLAGARVVRIPLKVRFRGVDEREALLVRGPAGWGEFAPFLEYPDREAARWLGAALEAAWIGHPEPRRRSVEVNATVPAVTPDRVASVLARYDGCRTVKVKVAERGQSLADDLARVAEVRALVGAGARIRVDANGAWTVEQAVEAISRLAGHDLEYVEQPCARVEELARLRRELARSGVDVAVAADESIRKASDPLAVRDLGAADLIVVKVAPLGGVRRALRIVEEAGLPAVVSSALDTSVGIAAGLALAAALPRLEYACGLGTIGLAAGDVARDPLLPAGGMLEVRPVVCDEELMARWAAPPERVDWWRDRLIRCHRLLG
ncbi:O-succinylbenzoate synthase [Austwickia chelonae]|uniref:o-succinylbenzoate synthase n=1 Tax=Austwickia chelonae NBRC 105200 TaxID=1184607 RepID=K6W4X8_9MICO|nr:o-succinylbenzoate synthase [Austwickia chelonae]GAB76882.1 o-succinylbenzoate synthase [Austwickia chelonae NBRC 105200]SEW31933.1 O-succinylbenzoate synthase [Austwickia chelonae]